MTARMYYDNDAESSGRWLAGASPQPSEGERPLNAEVAWLGEGTVR